MARPDRDRTFFAAQTFANRGAFFKKKRIEAIVANGIAPRLTAARKKLLAGAAIGSTVLIGLSCAASGYAQSQEKLRFEVASIKPLKPAAQGAGPIPLAPAVMPGGGIRSSVSIFNLICWAYHVDRDQLSGGPSWISSERYDIQAKPERFGGPED